jgi:hypothetical protein
VDRIGNQSIFRQRFMSAEEIFLQSKLITTIKSLPELCVDVMCVIIANDSEASVKHSAHYSDLKDTQ